MKVDDFIDFLEKYRGMDFKIVRSRNPEKSFLLEMNPKCVYDNKVVASLETDDRRLGSFIKNNALILEVYGN